MKLAISVSVRSDLLAIVFTDSTLVVTEPTRVGCRKGTQPVTNEVLSGI
ncbi:hypothetical protein [Aeoliella sp.]